MHLAHLADQSGLVPLAYLTHSFKIVSLVAHYRLNAELVIRLLQGPRLPDIVRQGLLGMHGNAVLHGRVGVGHRLGLDVVAEGVERSSTMTLLRELGCDIAQGYHIGKPMPINSLDTWLTRAAAEHTGGKITRIPAPRSQSAG